MLFFCLVLFCVQRLNLYLYSFGLFLHLGYFNNAAMNVFVHFLVTYSCICMISGCGLVLEKLPNNFSKCVNSSWPMFMQTLGIYLLLTHLDV